MSAHRFFLTSPLATGPAHLVPLSDDDLHHAVDVLRLRVGETIDAVEPGGRVFELRVTQAERHGLFADVLGETRAAALPRVALFVGVAKGEKMDDIVRDAVEVGAEAVVPLLSARCVVRLDARKRTQRAERWRRVAEAAAKQAKRASVPQVSDPLRVKDALSLLAEFDAAIVLWEEAESLRVREALAACVSSREARVAVIVGPEGGLSAEEVAALEALGATTATLGPTILRTETAAVVALALAIDTLASMEHDRA